MDNFRIDVVCEGQAALVHALALAYTNCPGGKARHYADRGVGVDRRLVLYWHDPVVDDVHPLPVALTLERAANFVSAWLDDLPDENRDGDIDIDGSLGKGWKVYNEAWGHVDDSPHGFVAIQGIWAWYGK